VLCDADLEVLAFLQQLDVVDNADIKSGACEGQPQPQP